MLIYPLEQEATEKTEKRRTIIAAAIKVRRDKGNLGFEI